MPKDPRSVAERWMEEVWSKRDVGAIDELHSPDFRDESLKDRPPGPQTIEAYKDEVAELFRAFPDFVAETEDLVVDEAAGKVALLWRATGTHRGEFMGAASSGKPVIFAGIEVLWVEGGRIVRRWGEWDGIALLEQLGLLHP